MKKGRILLGITLCSAMLLSTVQVNAQGGSIDFEKTSDVLLKESYHSVANSSDNGYVAVGTTNTSIPIITKHNVSGETIWSKQYTNSTGEFISVANTDDDGYIVAGTKSSSALLVKYDKDGTFMWESIFNGSKSETFKSVKQTSDGGYIAVGRTSSDDIDGITLNGDIDAIIVKFDKNGTIEWKINYGGRYEDEFNSVIETANGEYVVAGTTNSKNISGISVNGPYDAIIVKYDNEGKMIWQKNYGGSSFEKYYSVIETNNKEYVAVGYSDSNVFLRDAIIVKYDKDGNEVWDKNFDNTGYEEFNSVIMNNNEFMVVGYTNINNNYDGLIVKFDTNGKKVWQKVYESGYSDNFYSVIQNNNKEYVVAGLINNPKKATFQSLLVKYSDVYDVIKTNSTNGTYTLDKTSTKSGSTVTITPTPNKGYQVDTISVVDANNNKATVTNNTFTMPSSDVNVSVTFKPIEYKFTEGKDTTYNNTNLTFKLDGDITLVDKILVNGVELNESDYTLTEGSTIVTLKNDYLKTLKIGTYELEVTYTNGSSDKTTFKVEEKATETTDKEEVKEDNPKTLDNVLLYVTLGSISMIGLAGAGLSLKNKRFN